MAKIAYSLVLSIAASFAVVSASFIKEDLVAFRQLAKPIIAECAKKFEVIADDINTIENSNDGDLINPCFTACVFKKTKVLDSNGFYDVESSLSHLRSFINRDDLYAFFEKGFKQCSKVNNVPVSDGAQGCERASLLVECALEYAPELPIQ